ncbi:MAG: (2Fe-2S)-binding protein [Oscillospiraceae bacterium]
MRVEHHPILEDAKVADTYIYFDGQKIPALSGEPVAAALMAQGIRKFRYTEKKKLARGLFCGIGRCNDCKMIVDGVPNVRTCVTPVKEGMRVETQQGLGGKGGPDNG